MSGPFYFAFVGGAIQAQQTIVTNGTTHGGVAEEITVVGDTAGQQIANLASNAGLSVGSLYFISGPGIASGTFFIYDDKYPDRLNLSATTTAAIKSATFLVTNAILIGDLVVTLSSGSNTVNFGSVPDLLPGTYGIAGTGIGEMSVPGDTLDGITGPASIKIVPSAFFVYSGGTTAQMENYAAVKHSTTVIGPPPGSVDTYVVEQLDVSATTSGQVAVVITGHPSGNATLITAMPSGVLASLSPGLRYNISGPGLQIGTTFVAPSGSANQITIDLPATTAQFGTILTITGPRVPNEAFNPAVHDRNDLDILSVEINQSEGDFAHLLIEARARDLPGHLLAPGGHLWCWLSWDSAWTPGGTLDTANLTPLFNGKLIGLPRRQADELVQLEFLARPEDYNAQKENWNAELAVPPYYDPVWLAANANPDTVLETYSALWHVDRTSLALTPSDILQGEDGTIAITEAEAIYDKFSLAYGQPPINAVSFSGTVKWTQQADGFIDVTPALVDAFKHAGGAFTGTFDHAGASARHYLTGGGIISCLCGDGMKSDWPSPGTNIGGGWALSTQNDGQGIPECYIRDWVVSKGGPVEDPYLNITHYDRVPTAYPGIGGAVYINYGQLAIVHHNFPVAVFKVRMTLQYKAARDRTETVSGVMTADVQQVLSDPADADRENVALTSEYVSQGVDPGGRVPIGNLALNSYFHTDRGAVSFEYLMLLCRAKLRFRARTADVTFGVDWRTALGITLRKSVTYSDRRLPGGTCTGKVKQYTLRASTAGMWGEFTIGCSIGRGNTITGATGVNSYVVDGYVDGYQVVDGAQTQLLTSDIAYQTLDQFVVADDGLDLTNLQADRAVEVCTVVNGMKHQVDVLSTYQGTDATRSTVGAIGPTVLKELTTTATLAMKPLQGSAFATNFFPAVTMLAMPKTIDLGG